MRARAALGRSQGLALALLPAILFVVGPGAGCAFKPPAAASPEEAYEQLRAACDAGDAGRFFDALDTPTQWAVETVQKSQQAMRRIIIEAYPPAERDAALLRVPAACEEDLERPRRYFRRLPGTDETLAAVKRRLYLGTGQPIGSVPKNEGVAEVWRAGGSLFHFFRDPKGRWGYTELRELWERDQERALHELETVKENAALYRRRAGAAMPGAAAH